MDNIKRGETGYGRSGKGKNPQGGFDTGTGRFDLGVPGLVVECIEALYHSTGAKVAQRDRLFYTSVIFGIVLGLIFGYERHGMLYGPIGAALGVVFGAVGGSFAGLFLRTVCRPILKPEEEAIRQVRIGNLHKAGRAFRRAKKWIWRDRNVFERLASLALGPLGIVRADMPPEIAAANLAACEGILAESAGDMEEAINAYLRALEFWPRHTFVMASLMELIYRENMLDRASEVAKTAGRFIDRARDPRTAQAVKENLVLLEAALPSGEKAEDEGVPHQEEAPVISPDFLPAGPHCRLVENPGSQMSNGSLILSHQGDEKILKLPTMPFHLVLALAETMKAGAPESRDAAQIGWVTIQELLDSLPWTTPYVTNSNVHKLVYKVRRQLDGAGIDRNLIEENMNGCYRLRVPPDRIVIERASRV